MMNRRAFAQLAGASLFAASARKYRAAIIGHTGRGNYGHDWDQAFNSFASVDVAAVADPDDAGRQKAKARSRAARDYRDYREMLDREKPDIVAICPRWPDQRVPMFVSAAEHGAHILMEKPFARDLEDADRMVAAAGKYRVKVEVAHTARPDPVTLQVARMVRDGAIGQLVELRARGKEDRRAGGEDLMVLGTHCFDLMRCFAGDPQWVFANVTQEGKRITRDNARTGGEPVGPLAGDNIGAMFGFDRGVHGYFGSNAGDVLTGSRYGVMLYGTRGVIFVPLTAVPSEPAMILRSESWAMSRMPTAWEQIEPPAEARDRAREAANRRMAADLLEAIETGREPVCNARDGRWTIEMVMGVYRSHLTAKRMALPLEDRRHPLA